jgi:hypothetical protein
MALSINVNNGNICMVINGCHNGNCNHTTNGCGEFVTYIEKFNASRATPITRMFLHTVFGRNSHLDEILEKYDAYFANDSHHDESGIEYIKKLILDDCDNDNSWKICPVCKIMYMRKILPFENIHYITPQTEKCIDHSS